MPNLISSRQKALLVLGAFIAWGALAIMGQARESAAAAECSSRCNAGIPAGYSLAALQDALDQERATEFSFPPYPPLGIYVHEAYIAKKSIRGLSTDASATVRNLIDIIFGFRPPTPPAAGMRLDIDVDGDDRGTPSPLGAPSRNRIVVVLDFVHGRGYVVANSSQLKFHFRLDLGIITRTQTFTRTSTANSVSVNERTDDSWILADWVSPDTFRLRLHGLIALPFSLEDLFTLANGTSLPTAIDHQILIDRRTGAVAPIEGDNFPSVLTSQIRCDGSTVLRVDQRETKLSDLLDDNGFAYPQTPVNAQPYCPDNTRIDRAGRAPEARVGASTYGGYAPLSVHFIGGGSRAKEGRIRSYSWQFGDGGRAKGPSVEHVYTKAGNYRVELEVTDTKGKSGMAAVYIDVQEHPVNRAPEILGWWPKQGDVVGTNQPRLAVFASDPDRDPLQFQFRLSGDGVALDSNWISDPTYQVPPFRLDPATGYVWSFRVKDTADHITDWQEIGFSIQWMPVAAEMISTPDGSGYWTVDTGGRVRNFGNAPNYGSLSDIGVRVQNVIGMARTPDGGGYWIVGSDGGVFTFGRAQFYGSMGGRQLNAPVVGMSPTQDGTGYWLVAADGGVFSFGNARFFGSMGGTHLNAPVIGMATTPKSDGYWLAAKDGGVFSFGAARFYGSMGGTQLNAPVIDMVAHPSGRGYWLAAEDGGVFSFGAAPFYGSLGGRTLNGRITSMETTPNGRGYWLLACDGGIFAFGNARFFGSDPSYACRGSSR